MTNHTMRHDVALLCSLIDIVVEPSTYTTLSGAGYHSGNVETLRPVWVSARAGRGHVRKWLDHYITSNSAGGVVGRPCRNLTAWYLTHCG